jgi:prepilin-type N-terminal cleavage/methylation domain-containing protein
VKKAFTLVELLIAVLLLTLLIGTALFSYRQALLNISKAKKSTFNEVLKVHQIRTSIESMQHYVVDDYNQFNQPMKKLHIFFTGNKHYFQYISLNPTLYNIPTLSAFECKDNTLIYKEEMLYSRIDVNRPEFLEDSKKIIYWKDIKDCKFEYKIENTIMTFLENRVPNSIKIEYINNKRKYIIFTTIKSDYNISHYEIYERLYGE